MSKTLKSSTIIYDDLFVFDGTLRQLTINRVEVWAIPQFAALQKRAHEIKGFIPKRVPDLITLASKELLYVYLLEDPRSSLAKLEESDKQKRAKNYCLLPLDYTEDKLVKDARKVYKSTLRLSATGKAYNSALKTYNALSESLDETQAHLSFLRVQMNEKLDILKDNLTDDKTKEVEYAQTFALLKQVKDTQTDLVKTLQSLPAMEDTVSTLKAKWAQELGKEKEITGNRKKGNRED